MSPEGENSMKGNRIEVGTIHLESNGRSMGNHSEAKADQKREPSPATGAKVGEAQAETRHSNQETARNPKLRNHIKTGKKKPEG
jgi:hypothetical protein